MKSKEPITHNYLDRYLDNIRSKGRYSFTMEELRKEFSVSYRALKQNLYRLKSRNEVARIRQGFYVIIPPEYSKQGMLPPYLFIDDLLKSLNKEYYVSLLSAAALHGAAHQQPMEYFIVTQTPAPRNISNDKLKISFFSKSAWEHDDIVLMTTDAGYLKVSSVELTAFDLISYVDKIGLNRATTILKELSQFMKASALTKIAKRYPVTSVVQRLGYILQMVLGEDKLAESLSKVLNSKTLAPIPLSFSQEKHGEIDLNWKIIKNFEIESDI